MIICVCVSSQRSTYAWCMVMLLIGVQLMAPWADTKQTEILARSNHFENSADVVLDTIEA